MLNSTEIMDTIHMIDQQHLDIRTITMGISLLDCCDPDAGAACRKIYDKICRRAEKLVSTGEAIEREFGIPIVNKRISVTPMALVAGASQCESYVPFAVAMDDAAKATGVNVSLYNVLIAVLTAITIVIGMRMMGAMLISSLIIFPALTSMRVCRKFKSVILNSAVLSVVCLIAGLTISYVGATPAGASVVLANLAALIVYSCIGMIRNRAR